MSQNPAKNSPPAATVSDGEVNRLVGQLRRTELMRLGGVTSRLPACAYYSLATIPPLLRPRFSPPLTYLIQWIYAMDSVLDTCPAISYAIDFGVLLRAATSSDFHSKAELTRLPLHHDPQHPLPGLDFSLITLVETLQPLRRQLQKLAVSAAGPAGFDRELEAALQAMTSEARWRLERVTPGFGEYMAVATVSICGGLCLWSLLATLPQPEALRLAVASQAALSDIGARLANDLATRSRDQAEGAANALVTLTPPFVSRRRAEQRVRQLIDVAAARTRALTLPLDPEPVTPLAILNYYIHYSLVVARAMYRGMDFGSKGETK